VYAHDEGLIRSFFAPTLKCFVVGYELTSVFPGIPERAHPHHFYGRSGDPHPHPGSHAHALSASANKYFLDPARVKGLHRSTDRTATVTFSFLVDAYGGAYCDSPHDDAGPSDGEFASLKKKPRTDPAMKPEPSTASQTLVFVPAAHGRRDGR
jgi:hypothetical protein